MTLTTVVKAQGAGWRVSEIICSAGPRDPVLEEAHAATCVALVLDGSFSYRTPRGSATLAPGAILLGNAGECFACDHAHSRGDRCLSFHFDPDWHAAILDAPPLAFGRAALPPMPALARLAAAAEVAAAEDAALEEVAIELAGTVAAAAAAAQEPPGCHPRLAGRIADIAHWLERESDRPLPLALLAREAGMSRFHFLRAFRGLLGITPHQFLLRQRLRRAALRLRRTDEAVLTIALDCGFGDISEFNRRFRRVFGLSPTRFRSQRPGRR